MRLDIAVDEPGAVSIADSRACLHHQRDCFLHRISPALAKKGFQILAGDVLHYKEEQTLIESKVMDRDDVGMRKICRSARLLAEALLKRIIVGIILVQDLDRHRSLQH